MTSAFGVESRPWPRRRRTGTALRSTLVMHVCLASLVVWHPILPNRGVFVEAAPTPHHLGRYQRILRGTDGRLLRHACTSTSAVDNDQTRALSWPENSVESIFGNDFGSGAPLPFESSGQGEYRDLSSSPPQVRPSPSSCVLTLSRGGAGYRTAPQPIGQQPGPASSSRTYSSPSEAAASRDREATKEKIDSFLTRESRQTFIARVYAILSAQLAVTALSVFLFAAHPEWTQNMLLHLSSGRTVPIVPIVSLAVSTISAMWIGASPRARRSSPLKWQLLALFTVGEAISVGFVSSFYQLRSVISAMSATAAATLSVTMYTMMNNNPKYDLSQWGQGIFSLATLFIIYGLINLLERLGVLPSGFLPFSEGIYSFFGAALFSLFLAYDTRLIIGGKHTKYQMNEKDYVYGAMSIYMDIINIFIYLLRLIGDDRD